MKKIKEKSTIYKRLIDTVNALPDTVDKTLLVDYINWVVFEAEIDAYINARAICENNDKARALEELSKIEDTIYNGM